MKEKIHPKYFETSITCACGNVIHTRSTVKDIRVEICSKCHPYFTGSGEDRLVDTAGRIDKFKRRFAKTGGKTVRKVTAVRGKKKKAAVASRKARV